MDILVFKTDVRSKEHTNKISPHLNSIDGIIRWNFDLDDRDKILRVEAKNLSAVTVEMTLNRAGYSCEELPD